MSIGSFINVVVDRSMNDESLMGRSHCDYCKKKLSWCDLIPVFSYLFLKGRCRYCHTSLSFQYPLVELLTGVWFMCVVLCAPNADLLRIILYWGIVSSAWVIFLSDLKYQLIADNMLIAALVFILLLKLYEKATLFSLGFDLLAAVVTLLPIGFFYLVSKGKWMGEGDIYIAALMGLFLGIQKGLVAVYLAFVVGAVIGIILLLIRRKKMKSAIPFGPFLIIGSTVAVLWGGTIIRFILKMYGY